MVWLIGACAARRVGVRARSWQSFFLTPTAITETEMDRDWTGYAVVEISPGENNDIIFAIIDRVDSPGRKLR